MNERKSIHNKALRSLCYLISCQTAGQNWLIFFGNPWVPLGLNKLNKIRNFFLSKLEFFNIPRETKGHWSAGHSGP